MSAAGWARHEQAWYVLAAKDPRNPLWLRIVWLADGRLRQNGHVNFAPGELARRLGTLDKQTGEVLNEPTRQVLQKALRDAIDRGFLAAGSGTRCLIVPAARASGGLGYPNEQCPVHPQTRTARSRGRTT